MSPRTSTDAIPVFTTFGPLLRYLRMRARLSQRELALVAGYSESQISRLEGDQRLPDLDVLRSHVIPALLLDDLPTLADRLIQLASAAREGQPTPAAPPPAAIVPLHNNLPMSLTTMVDRVPEVATLVALLERPELRLLTLTGPPGIGKTRLSLQAAARMQAQFADGVLFVALALIQDPALVVPTIAQTYGLAERDDRPALNRLATALRGRRLLLVLDNFEQVVAAAPQLAELLQMAPGITALVTSRVVLQISGEQQYSVPPLELPAAGLRLPTEELARYPGVQLFIERVRGVRPDFMLTPENAPTVVEICTRLDGLPLAIELAAARSRLFTPAALLERLRGPAGATTLTFLTNGPRDLLTHQRTLRGTIDWSYALLSHIERQIFRQLGVFIGGGTAEATCAIAHDQSSTASAARTIEVLESLVNQSMVKVEPGPDGSIRFALLEVLREYALDQLKQADQLDTAQQRHASYYAQLASVAVDHLSGAEQDRWLDRLQIEYANLNVALEWHALHDIAGGLRCATALCRFWLIRGMMTEGRSWFARLLALDSQHGSDCSARAAGLTAAGFLAYQQGHQQQAETLSSEALDLYCQLDDQQGVADALMNLGYVAFHRSAYSRATAIYSECLDLYRQLNERTGEARALRSLALVAKDQGDFGRATRLHEENLALCHQLGDRRGAASTLLNLSIVAYWKGEYARARSLAEQAAGIHRELNDRMGLAYALDQLGMAAYKQGQHAPALTLLAESLALFRALDEKIGMAMVYNDMGIIAQAHGTPQRAAQLQRDGLELAIQIGDQRRAIFCIEALASAIGASEPLQAARFFGAAEALREALGTPLPAAEIASYERGVITARARVDAADFSSAWEAGRLCSAEQIYREVVS